MKVQSDRRLIALNNGAGNVSTAFLDLCPSGGAHTPNGRLNWVLPAQPLLADAGTVTCELTHCATSGGSYTTVPGYGNMVVTGAGGAGAAATTFSMPIAAHVLRYVKFKFTQVGTGNNSALSAEGFVEV